MDDLSHAEERVIFNALGGAYKKHLWLKPLRHVLKRASTMVRGHHADDNFRAGESFLEIVGGSDGSGQRAAGKKQIIGARAGDALQNIFFQGPQADFVVTAAARHHRQGRSPCASADDGNPAQGCFSATAVLLARKRRSVPPRSRAMF